MKLLLALLLTLICASARADVRSDQLEAEAWNALQRMAWAEAEQRFHIAIEADPYDALSWTGIGYAVFWQERFDDASVAFEVANRLRPSAYAYSGLGHSAVERASRTFVPIERRRELLERAGHAFAEAQALHPNAFGVLAGMLFLSWFAPMPGAPPLSLGLLAALALLVLLIAAVRRVARKTRAELRAEVRALLVCVLVPYAVTRAIVLAAFFLTPLWLRQQAAPIIPVLAGNGHPILEAVAERWDANLYVAVALRGYQATPPVEGTWGLVGQLPLLPVLYRMTLHVIGDGYWSAFFIAHAALMVAACAMFLFVRQTDGEVLARRATWVLLLVPGALFGSALYAEPLALAGLIAAYAHARQERVGLSIVSGMLAGMARINALAAVPMLALFALTRALRGSRTSLLVPLGPLLGLLVFMLYTHFELGDAFAYFHELRQHRFTNQGPAPTLRDIGLLLRATWRGEQASIADHNAIGFLALACLLAYAWAGADLLRRKRYAEASFVITGVMLAIGSNLVSQPRYLWLLFPACISFAYLAEKPLVRWTLGVLLAALLFFEASAFAAFYFVT